MTTKEFDSSFNYKHVNDIECCLNCIHSRRWSFEGRYSEDPSDLQAMCLDKDAPSDPILFGGHTERKYVGAFFKCDKYSRDKNVK